MPEFAGERKLPQMKTKSQTKSKFTRTLIQKWLITNRAARMTALIVFAMAAAAFALSTLSLAQREKRLVSTDNGPVRATSVPTPGRSSPTGASTAKSRHRSLRYRQQKEDGVVRGLEADRMARDVRPKEGRLEKARTFKGDLRQLLQTKPVKVERPEREEPEIAPREYVPAGGTSTRSSSALSTAPSSIAAASAPAPAPSSNFDGLDFANFGNGHPPDTNGDVGPTYYIQSINTSLGIYDKATGARVAAFGFNTFMSQGNFGNLCDTNNFGDPVILYDTFEDRWVVTDFAFSLDGSGNVINPPGAYQCFAVSRSGDPVAGGWNYYSLHMTDALNDYPKLGIWPDGIYMSANMFAFPAGGAFQGPRVWALNKAQMYAGAPTVQSVSFNAPTADFAILPSNARLQTGTPPPGSPNYFLSTWEFLNAVTVYKFHVDWNRISTSTFTGPDTPLAASSWPNANVPNAPSLGGNSLDVLQIRAMMQNQYTNLGGVESLWATHTVRRGNTTGFAAPRYYQVGVTGGTVAASMTQAATWDPDGANVLYRFMPSLAVDRAGNMALGYSTSSSTTKPAIMYAGRLATDPINTFSQTEQLLIQGAGTQTGNCGSSACIRWGDYSAMTLDPNGCTFWFTSEYYATDGLNHQTRIGSFVLPQCTTVSNGSVQGTVTATAGGAPIGGATVAMGSRTTTTNASGFYSFSGIPAGTYPVITTSAAGFNSSTANSLVVNDGSITTQDFSLSTSSSSGCFTDTSQSDFQTGIPNNVDLTTSGGDVVLTKLSLDQQNTTLGSSGVGITITTWGGQTFTPAVTGQLTKADINLFCSGCTGTTPNLTLSLRATSGGLPTGADLASATVTGNGSGSSSYFTGTFASPPTLNAGTVYALVIRPTVNPSPGTYALTRSGTSTAGANVYAGGARVSGATSGTVWSTPTTGGITTDAGFRTYIDSGYTSPGSLVSSVKDGNPAPFFETNWTTLSWTANTPANTAVSFQVAGSNSPNGPFNFVGPDGTASTFFTTSGSSLSQFNGLRYLQYQAVLTTSNSAATPTLNDVSVCFSNVPTTAITANDASAVKPLSGNGTMNFTVTLNAPAPAPFTVTYSTATDVGGANPAVAGTDYTAVTSGTVTFNAGDQTQIIPIALLPGSTATDQTFLVSLGSSTLGNIVRTPAKGTIKATKSPSVALLSEFRTSGPNGVHDGFVEIYNNTNSPLTVHATDGGSGWVLVKSGASCGATPVVVGKIPENTIIPARGHYLFTGSAYSLGGYAAGVAPGATVATGDQVLTSDLDTDTNIGLFTASGLGTISSANRLDAAGFGTAGVCGLLEEGIPLLAASGSSSQYSFVRNAVTGQSQDTDNNRSDFVVVTTSPGTPVGSNAALVLGTPGPENLSSPLPFGLLTPGLIDPDVSATLPQNRVRTTGSYTDSLSNTGTYTLGTLAIRRLYTNNTGQPVTRLRFRIIDITGYPAPAGVADLRVITSPGASITNSRGQAITVVGTILEQPPAQVIGGGINSTVTVTLASPLPTGQSVAVEWLLGLKQGGNFRFTVSIEGLQNIP
jgi:hypothetical protein